MISYLVISLLIISGFVYYLVYIRPKFNPLNKAEQFVKTNQLHDAIIEYKKVIDEYPDNFVVHHRLAELYLTIGEIDQAVIHLEKILEIGKFNYEVDQLSVLKKLAKSYYVRDEVEKAFQMYLDILKNFPADIDSLYHVSFILLSQEEFDSAQRYFERLLKLKNDSYEILFGAGICNYQNMRIQDAIDNFRSALQLKPQSEIAQIALAFAFNRKRDYRQALTYITKVAESTQDPDVQYLAKRFQAFLYMRLKRHDEGIKLFQDLLEIARKNANDDAEALALHDLGYALLKNEQSSLAYDVWNELYRKDRNYKNIQFLVTQLRKEMEVDKFVKEESASIMETITAWMEEAFPQNLLWDMCGLKGSKRYNLKDVVVTTRITFDDGKPSSTSDDIIQKYIALDTENFRIISNRLASKLGFKVDQILQTYREADGVDFLAVNPETKDKVLIWVRRWTKTNVGEITLRNFAQAINDMKVKQGILITTADLTDIARETLRKLSKILVIYPDEIEKLLRGLL